jgi:hypothetical protein
MSRYALLGAAMAVGVAAIPAFAQETSTGPAVNPTTVIKKTAQRPPVGAKPVKTVGRKALLVSTANGESDTDPFWIERIDVDGDGDVEETHLVWDDEDKVLYAYTTGDFACRSGGSATFDVLIAAYGANNSHHKPAGSGFWMADLDGGECGASAKGLWGCRFDPSGKPTTCGTATVDQKNDDLVVASSK